MLILSIIEICVGIIIISMNFILKIGETYADMLFKIYPEEYWYKLDNNVWYYRLAKRITTRETIKDWIKYLIYLLGLVNLFNGIFYLIYTKWLMPPIELIIASMSFIIITYGLAIIFK